MVTIEKVTRNVVGRIITEQGLDSIRVRSASLNALESIDRVILLGSTCVGKSTLEKAVRTASLEDSHLKNKICVPQRVVTRPSRADDVEDMFFCSTDDLRRMYLDNDLGLYGVKIMESEREEPYGYLKPKEGTLPVFFANNQTLKNKSSLYPEGVLNNALIILIYAPDWVREQRLKERSPDLFEQRPEEVAFRLSQGERAIGLASDAHLILRNYGRYASRSVNDLIKLIKNL